MRSDFDVMGRGGEMISAPTSSHSGVINVDSGVINVDSAVVSVGVTGRDAPKEGEGMARQRFTARKVWCSGDHVYAAFAGAELALMGHKPVSRLLVDGVELPVAEVSGLDYRVVRWVLRGERFPEPLKGFNE